MNVTKIGHEWPSVVDSVCSKLWMCNTQHNRISFVVLCFCILFVLARLSVRRGFVRRFHSAIRTMIGDNGNASHWIIITTKYTDTQEDFLLARECVRLCVCMLECGGGMMVATKSTEWANEYWRENQMELSKVYLSPLCVAWHGSYNVGKATTMAPIKFMGNEIVCAYCERLRSHNREIKCMLIYSCA